MIGLSVTKLGEAMGADVGAIAGLPRIVHLVGALARNITRVPFGAGSGRSILLHFSCLGISGDTLYGLHKTGWVKF